VFALIWPLYQLRMRQLTLRLQGRMEERLLERERIARELHDTLLQGIQGLILRFQAAAARIPASEPAREIMDKALDRADDVLTESRDRVKNLRSSTGASDDLPRMLENVGNDVAQLHTAQFRLIAEGETRALHPIVREEASKIGSEALLNAFRHGGARTVEAEITYNRKELRVRIRDDGRGIEHSVLHAGGRAGHWGLAGMRERARKIRGRLDIWSQPGSGTEVELRVPAAVAYADERAGARWARHLE
jgi:signal transduction histidine kinase